MRSSYEVRHRYRPKVPVPRSDQNTSTDGQGQGQGHKSQERLELGQGLRAGLRKGSPHDVTNNDGKESKKLIGKATGTSIENYEYELVEIATVECPAIVRPFVKAKFEKGHQEVLQRVVDQVVKEWMEELRSSKGSSGGSGGSSSAAAGQGRGRTLLQEIQQQG